MSVLYPAEISLNHLELGCKSEHLDGDFSRPILHQGEPLVVQLSNCTDLFGVLEYTNPTGRSRITKYSTGVCLSNNAPNIKHFLAVLQELERMVQDEFQRDGWEFISTIKENKKGEKHLRVKLPFRWNAMQFEIYNNKQKTWMNLNRLRQELTHGRIIDVILQLNPIWNSGKKYGISWKLCAIDFHGKEFRREQPQVAYTEEKPKPSRRRAKRKGKRKRRNSPPPTQITPPPPPPEDQSTAVPEVPSAPPPSPQAPADTVEQ